MFNLNYIIECEIEKHTSISAESDSVSEGIVDYEPKHYKTAIYSLINNFNKSSM